MNDSQKFNGIIWNIWQSLKSIILFSNKHKKLWGLEQIILEINKKNQFLLLSLLSF